ncbi:MAG: leucyl aminopeptidase [Chlamydiota bacterium]|nr:leucyl aminopeptidase [Chlamydiota bacterium]
MRIKFHSKIESRPKSDLIVIPFLSVKGKAKVAINSSSFDGIVKPVLNSGDFTGSAGEIHFVYGSEGKETRTAMLGLGDEKTINTESIRRAYSALVKKCHQNKIQKIAVLVPELNEKINTVVGFSEGIFLTNYVYGYGKSAKEAKLITELHIIGCDSKQKIKVNETRKIVDAVTFTKDLVNGNADEVTPKYLSQVAKKLAKKHSKVSATIFDKKRIIKEKMELLLSVNRGSSGDPAFIILKYRGNPKSKEHTVVVGKGVTYDTGGLSLKPTGGMLTMRSDMGGAATALGTIDAVASLGLKVNLTAVVPATENGIDSCSYKPGDVYGSYLGKTVEIGNTDAEGRLILADALAYASQKLKPTRIIDFATLTGAVVISLGRVASGLMTNDEKLAEALIAAGNETSERTWRLPLFDEYRKQLNSDVADLKNVGGREAGSIVAGMFLQEFVGKGIPWAHIDIAGTAFIDRDDGYLTKNATGVGVRLMVSFLTSS